MTREDIVRWAAGFFDGEGSVVISRGTRPSTGKIFHGLKCRVVQVDPAPIKLLQDTFGGRIHLNKTRTKTWQRCWIWEKHGEDAQLFLSEIAPFSIVKRQAIQIGLEFPCLHMKEIDWIWRERESCYNALRFANRNGAAAVNKFDVVEPERQLRKYQRAIICTTNNTIYASPTIAAHELGIPLSSISCVLGGFNKSAGKDKFHFVYAAPRSGEP